MTINRLYNAKNPWQGKAKKVLCLCSAGLLRSPTAAVVLAQEPFNYNTRAAGVHEYALIPMDAVLQEWADEIVVMERSMLQYLSPAATIDKTIIVLDIPDKYGYREPELMELIKQRYLEADDKE